MADYLAGFYPEWVDKEENPRQIILDLGKMITNRIPVKLGFQKLNKYDPEYWGLATLLTDEQAEVALKMGVRKPKTMTACFSEYSRKVLSKAKSNRVPIREQLKQAADQLSKEKPKQKERAKEVAHEDR